MNQVSNSLKLDIDDSSWTDEELLAVDLPSKHNLSTEELGRWFQLKGLEPKPKVISLTDEYEKLKADSEAEQEKRTKQRAERGAAKNPVPLIESMLLMGKVTFERDLLYKRGHPIALDDLAREIYLGLKGSSTNVTKSDVYDVIVQKKFETREAGLVKLRSVLAFSEVNDEIHRWVTGICGDRADRHLVEGVLAHFIWQVKRKLHGLEVGHHLMPVLTGKQGSGKSTAIYKLLEPLSGFIVSLDVSACNDQREYFNFHRNLICFFDELARADRTDVNSLKKVITAPVLTHRILGSHQSATAPNLATFIGATNGSISEMIYDPTGMRRFF